MRLPSPDCRAYAETVGGPALSAGAVEAAERAAAKLAEVHARFAECFPRSEPRRSALDYMRGLLSGIERRNGWTLSEHAGRTTPYALQDLLDRGTWDSEWVRDEVRAFGLEHLGDIDAVLVGVESGFAKKGMRSAGVQPQYWGTPRRWENCQIGMFLIYSAPLGRTLVDRELYVPDKTWMANRARCRAAAIPDDLPFRTKPELLRLMIERAVAADVPFTWMTANETCGPHRALRDWCHACDVHYVMATVCTDLVEIPEGPHEVRYEVRVLMQTASELAWRPISCPGEANEQREFEWCRVEIPCTIEGRARWVLARRSRKDGDVAYFLCFGPQNAQLTTLVQVAGIQRAEETSFQASRTECGLDQYQVRKYHAWYRHATLAIAVDTTLAVAEAQSRGARLRLPIG